MAENEYVQKTWSDGEVIYAKNMNNIEAGINSASEQIEANTEAINSLNDNKQDKLTAINPIYLTEENKIGLNSPIASTTNLGMIIVGKGLSIDNQGTLETVESGSTYTAGNGITIDSEKKISLKIADENQLGGIKVGEGLTITDGVLSTKGSGSKMDSNNPEGTGSFSMNRKEDTTIGEYSVAVGKDCSSTGAYSYAEGLGTQAFGDYQHVQGKYNFTDKEGTFLDIVGNGENNSSHSNAYALDKDGNGYYSGDVYINCENNSTNGKKVITAEDIEDKQNQTIEDTEGYFQVDTVEGALKELAENEAGITQEFGTIRQELTNLGKVKVNVSDIVDDLTQQFVCNMPLSAGMGYELDQKKQDKPKTSVKEGISTLKVEDNYEYYLKEIENLTFTYPTVEQEGTEEILEDFTCLITLTTTNSDSITITFPSKFTKYIGNKPSFGPSETWEISIKNGIVVAGQVVS